MRSLPVGEDDDAECRMQDEKGGTGRSARDHQEGADMRRMILLVSTMAAFLFFSALLSDVYGDTLNFTKTTESTHVRDETWPSFTASKPGFYVNGWPGFVLSYPSDWVGEPPDEPWEFFRATAPGRFQSPNLVVCVFSFQEPLGWAVADLVSYIERIGSRPRVVYERPTRLWDGTGAYEAEIAWVYGATGAWINTFLLAAKIENIQIQITLHDKRGEIGEDLKAIAYSLKLKPGKEEPFQVPEDVQALIRGWSKAMADHDMKAVMGFYSDEYIHDARTKKAEGEFLKSIMPGITSFNLTITAFESMGDKAWLTGFIEGDFGRAIGLPEQVFMENGQEPLGTLQIIKEKGEWKWYGNHKQDREPSLMEGLMVNLLGGGR